MRRARKGKDLLGVGGTRCYKGVGGLGEAPVQEESTENGAKDLGDDVGNEHGLGHPVGGHHGGADG